MGHPSFCGEGEVPAEDFAVEDERAVGGGIDMGKGFGEFGETFGDVVAVAGVEGDAAGVVGIAAVELGAHAVVLVFEEGEDGCGLQVVSCRLIYGGEAGDGFFGRGDGGGEHETEGVEEAHAGLGEGSVEGAADGATEVGLEHDGVADLFDWRGGCGGDGFFDEGLFYADAHIAEHELEEVLGFERSGVAEEVQDQGGADGGGAGAGHGGEGFSYVGEGESGRGYRTGGRGGRRPRRRGLRGGGRQR